MITYFPSPYPDELWYSVIARYKKHMGYTKPMHLNLDIKGIQNKSNRLLPRRLEKTTSQLAHLKYMSTSEIMENHSLYYLYTYLENYKNSKRIRDYMFHERNQLPISHRTMGKKLKLCTNCMEEDIEKYGEPYWHCAHQYSGVLLCYKHKLFLIETNVETSAVNNAYIDINEAEQVHDFAEFNFNSNILYKITLEILKMGNPNFEMSKNKRTLILFSFCDEYGYVDKKGRITFENLSRDFIGFYTEELLDYYGGNLEEFNLNDTLFFDVKKLISTGEPLMFVMVYLFFNKTLEDVLLSEFLTPFGSPPFLCDSPFCDSTDLEYNFSMDTGNAKLELKCDCGYESVSTYRNHQTKTKALNYGLRFEIKLKNLLFNQNLTVEEISQIIHEHPLDTEVLLLRNISMLYSDQEEKYYQDAWEELVKNNPNTHLAEVKHQNFPIYVYIYPRANLRKFNRYKELEINDIHCYWETRDEVVFEFVKKKFIDEKYSLPYEVFLEHYDLNTELEYLPKTRNFFDTIRDIGLEKAMNRMEENIFY